MRNLPGIVVLTALLLQACVPTGGPAPEPAAPAAPAAYTPLANATAKQRFSEALTLLARGEPNAARAELALYLDQQPGSRVARDLLRQIDTPAAQYFPPDYEEVTLGSGDSLSSLSKQYLGSVYKFHALAKYNGIIEPQSLKLGQKIRIPLTDTAAKAFASGGAAPPAEAESEAEPEMPEPEMMPAAADPVVADEPEPPIEEEPEPETAEPEAPRFSAKELAEIEALHKEALNAYRRQKLNKAIGLWDEVLELDPEHENARLYRSQAISLKKKLSNLN
ncbi:MAG: LysM peptidoglycan-binding domain-containing protein [Halioglobus sp.]|nr:LysM peptidoglycan-binding domain-containing protein [Halioglobus sp.]